MKKGKADHILVIIVAAIIFLGLFVLASASSIESQRIVGHSYYFFFQQLLLGFLPGIIIAFLLYKTPLDTIRRWAPILLLFSLFLLLLVFVPSLGEKTRGATRWLNMGFFSFQPAELLKLTFILYLASWLAVKNEKKKKNKPLFMETFVPFVIIAVTVGLALVFQPDISTLGVILLVALLMYFIARTPLWHTITFLFSGAAALFFLVWFSPYRLSRVMGMLNPDIDPLGVNYQIRQALLAVGSGGIFGLGFGLSQQKFGFLPFPSTDSIFAIFAEEAGFLGSIILLLLFAMLFWRGFLIARRSNNEFCRLVAMGIVGWIFIQTFINIGSMVGIIPFTGIPLPFISYGKSHLIAEMAGIGVLLNASKHS